MHDIKPVLLSISYFGPIQYFTKVVGHKVIIEKYENYSKQSYRNRCDIYGANGCQTLVIPVKNEHGQKTLITDVKIDYDMKWQIVHWRSIESAYRSAPFYEFYIDEFRHFFFKQFNFLFDLNIEIFEVVLKQLEIQRNYSFTDDFKENHIDIPDYRFSIHPKKRMQQKDKGFGPQKYPQVFAEKHGFLSNLSILDLIFNEGPQAKQILINSIKIL